MYPILVNALAATAGNLIDRWAQSSFAPKASAPAAPFSQMLQSATAPRNPIAAAIEKLRNELMASPEIRTAMDSSDPSKRPTFNISADGSLSAQMPGQSPRAIALSPETAALARLLASMLPANSAL